MIVKSDREFIRSYLEDASNLQGGYAEKVVIPQNIEEIKDSLKQAHEHRVPVTISGAGTGQAGARIPFGGIVISLEKLNAIKEIKKCEKGGCVSAEAGVVIQDLKAACERKGLFYTYDPTEQTAFLGGTISTNASGGRSLRYGPTRKYVNALTVILADGTALFLRRGAIKAKKRVISFEAGDKRYDIKLPGYTMPMVKHSAGYYVRDDMDLVDLFIGQEGTLGLIVDSELELPDKPPGLFSAFAFFKEANAAWDFAGIARDANALSVEYFDGNSIRLLAENYPNVPGKPGAAIFFEDEIWGTEDRALEKWDSMLSMAGVSSDNTWFAMNEKNQREFCEKRHSIPQSLSEMARRSPFPKISTDLAVPLEKLTDMMRFYEKELEQSSLQHFIFGHIGDAHLHVNMLPESKKDYELAEKIRIEFVKKSISYGGTISAEHGVGKTKKEFLKLLYGEKGVGEMIAVKKALDPNLILSRGNIFDIF